MSTGRTLILVGVGVGLLYLVSQGSASAGANPNLGLPKAPPPPPNSSGYGGGTYDRVAKDFGTVADATLRGVGVPGPVADFAAKNNFLVNAKRIATYGLPVAATVGKTVAAAPAGAVAGAKAALSTLTFGLL